MTLVIWRCSKPNAKKKPGLREIYEKIAAKHPQHPPSEWLFLSDNVKEVDAAIAAGMQSFVVQRPGNPALADGVEERHRVIRSLDEL